MAHGCADQGLSYGVFERRFVAALSHGAHTTGIPSKRLERIRGGQQLIRSKRAQGDREYSGAFYSRSGLSPIAPSRPAQESKARRQSRSVLAFAMAVAGTIQHLPVAQRDT